MALLAVLPAAGCGAAPGEGPTISVFAAASLTDAFSDIADSFEAGHPGTTVVLSFAASSTLREQILEGAPADVFASADPETMAAVADAGLVDGEPAVFAINALTIAVPIGNPAGIVGIEDFADPAGLTGACAPQVPCGALADAVFTAAGITPRLATAEPNVRSLLSKIENGDLDAGLVYVTDAAGSGRVDSVPLPEPNPSTAYPIATLAGAPPAASGFVSFVLSPAGQGILAEHQFGAP